MLRAAGRGVAAPDEGEGSTGSAAEGGLCDPAARGVRVVSAPGMCDLPGLPEPHEDRKGEMWLGIWVVLGLIFVLVGFTHLLSYSYMEPLHRQVADGLMEGYAVAALLCLAKIIWGDMGEVRRSRATCLPIPPEVSARLAEGAPLSDLQNVHVRDRSYCVRCCVWRNQKDHPHHCSTCQRCVQGFDHHCGVFGRCIAEGNMRYFRGLIAMGGAGWITFLFFLVAAQGGGE
eukprot:TRINITY_DN41771_c0_g1_i1.p1 TRINITY_DN41771_c0_g1~~TRINITY_DN41771_c0_g1_i1.p1  ORF type:complete len:260 (+),score=68.03 TRINITY_DN41771_c0_g1_i1:93-782(+)